MPNRRHHAERVTDALRRSLWWAAPGAGKRRIGHGNPWRMLIHTTLRTAKPQSERVAEGRAAMRD
jgi:hypothetical protein